MNQTRTTPSTSQFSPTEEDLFNRELLACGQIANVQHITSRPIVFISNDLYLPGKVASTQPTNPSYRSS
jgi:hypothetical protein